MSDAKKATAWLLDRGWKWGKEYKGNTKDGEVQEYLHTPKRWGFLEQGLESKFNIWDAVALHAMLTGEDFMEEKW